MTRVVARLAVAGMAVGAALAVPAVAFAAGTGSGGSSAAPGPSGVPGGFQTVVSSQVISSTGTTISGSTGGVQFTATVPPTDTNLEDDVFSVTTGVASQISVSGATAVAAIGFDFDTDSTLATKVSGTFTTPVQVSLVGNFPTGTEVEYWDTATSAWVPVTTGSSTTAPADEFAYSQAQITFKLSQDPDVAVVEPGATVATAADAGTGSGTGTVAGATTVSTGKPFVLEGVLAALLMVGGGTTVWRIRRMRAQRQG